MNYDLALYPLSARGLWIDGSLGRDHMRKRMAVEMRNLYTRLQPFKGTARVDAVDTVSDARAKAARIEVELEEDFSDDDTELIDGVMLMNKFCANGVYFDWTDGGLYLVAT